MKRKGFRNALFVCAISILFCGCVSTNLYYWGSNASASSKMTPYEEAFYTNYKTQSPESLCALVCIYEDMVKNPGGKRGVIPPGICAEYGYILLQPETAAVFSEYATSRQKKKFQSENYSSDFQQRGMEMLQKEIELYPEAVIFIKPLIDRLNSK